MALALSKCVRSLAKIRLHCRLQVAPGPSTFYRSGCFALSTNCSQSRAVLPKCSLRSKRSCAFLAKEKPRIGERTSFGRAKIGRAPLSLASFFALSPFFARPKLVRSPILGVPFAKNAQERLLRRLTEMKR